MEKQVQTIKSLLESLLEKLTVSGHVDVVEGEFPQFVIRTQEAGILIGENGKHLIAMNHLLKKMVDEAFRREELEKIQFLLDVNDYQVKKIEEIKNIARMNAQRARYFKKEIELDHMNPYERRIVHSALTEYPDIKTESVGEGLQRRVVIKIL